MMAGQGPAQPEEEVMHPVISQDIAVQRISDMRRQAAVTRQAMLARRLRRARQAASRGHR
jgi:hypothetical protein